MNAPNRSINSEYLFGPMQPIEFPVNALFSTGNYVVDCLDGSVNPYREGIVTSQDKRNIYYLPQNENNFWDEHLSSDTVSFTVRDTRTQEKVNVNLAFTRFRNPSDYFPGAGTLNLPEDVASHIRLDLEQYLRLAPFQIVRVMPFDKRIFFEVVINPNNTSLDLFLNTEHGCYPDYSEMYLVVRHPDTGIEAFTVIFIVWSKATFYAYPKLVEVSEPLPAYILSPITVNNNQNFVITGTQQDVPERGHIEAVGTSLKYTFNLESGYWNEVGKSDMISAGVASENGMYSGNNHKIIKVASSETNAQINSSQNYSIYGASLLIVEALTPDATYTAPYKVSGTIEIRKGDYQMGIPFEGIVDLADPYTLVPDAYSQSEFSGNTELGGVSVLSGELQGLTGTIAVDETITFSSGNLNT